MIPVVRSSSGGASTSTPFGVLPYHANGDSRRSSDPPGRRRTSSIGNNEPRCLARLFWSFIHRPFIHSFVVHLSCRRSIQHEST
jgi:hypothetical protein